MSLETYATYILPVIMVGMGFGALVLQRLVARARRRMRERRTLVLDAIRAQQPNGTGYTLTRALDDRVGRFRSLSLFYTIVADLQRKGVVSSRWGTADKPGGPRHRHYWITADHPELTHDGGRG